MNRRKILYIVIVIVCLWSIFIGVYDQVNKKAKKATTNTQKEVPSSVTPAPEKKQSQEELIKEFDKIFTDTVIFGQFDKDSLTKIDQQKDIVYTYSAQLKKEMYDIDVNFPIINIQWDSAQEINKTAKSLFIDPANEIIQNAAQQTIYTVSYAAYVNGDILSIIIKSTSKEEGKAQRIQVKAYNLNLVTGKEATIDDLLKIRQVSRDEVSNKINQTISDSIKEASSIQELGYEVYTRDVYNSMYNIDNLDAAFLDKDGALCIVFAYGNSEVTSEMDVVKI